MLKLYQGNDVLRHSYYASRPETGMVTSIESSGVIASWKSTPGKTFIENPRFTNTKDLWKRRFLELQYYSGL
jgi:hypothetical protein